MAQRHRLAVAADAMDQALPEKLGASRGRCAAAIKRYRDAAAGRFCADADPLPRDLLIAGPIALTLYASIDQDDTNWIIILKDVGPDVGVQSAREGERA